MAYCAAMCCHLESVVLIKFNLKQVQIGHIMCSSSNQLEKISNMENIHNAPLEILRGGGVSYCKSKFLQSKYSARAALNSGKVLINGERIALLVSNIQS